MAGEAVDDVGPEGMHLHGACSSVAVEAYFQLEIL